MPHPDASKPPDKFLITLPSLHIEGLIYGTPFVELNSTSYITSTSGYTAKMTYSGKGWLSGDKNSVAATLYRDGEEKDVLYNAIGAWTKTLSFYKGPAKTNSSKTLVDKYDAAKSPGSQLAVRPVEEQHPLESRRAWGKVAAAVAKGDMDAVGIEKGRIEQAQRDLRAKEKGEGRVWERRYFSAVKGSDDVLEELGLKVGVSSDGDADQTGGLWRFDREKEKKVVEEGDPPKEEVERIEKEFLGQGDTV